MTNQNQFVAESEPVSDKEMYGLCSHAVTLKNNLPVLPVDSSDNAALQKRAQAVSNIVSGTSIMQNVDTSNMTDIMEQINSGNASLNARQDERHKEETAKQEHEYENLIAARRGELLRARVAEEERIRKERKEKERLFEEELARQQESAGGIKQKMAEKMAGLVSNWDKAKERAASAKEKQGKGAENRKESTREDNADGEYIARHDLLTGLLNATAYNADIKTASLSSGIIFVDANNLKYINDTYGHEAGDKLLLVIAKTLLRYFDGEAYRLGGDEFVVITNRSQNKVKKIINNMKLALERQTKLENGGMIYSVAVGYAYGDGKAPLSEIRAKADALMYEDKAAYKKARSAFLGKKQQAAAKPTEGDELLALAYTDTLTGLKNSHAFKGAENASVLTLVCIAGFAGLSRADGDEFVKLTGKCIKNNAKPAEAAYYLGGGDFVILSEYTPDVLISTIKAKLHGLSIDIHTQMMTGADTNEELLSLAKKRIAVPKEKPKSYNERLASTQRQLKENVCANHEPVMEEDIYEMMNIVQRKSDEIIMVFMTSVDFDSLFIFLDVEDFLHVARDIGADIDYSYIYAVYPGGALFYGSDDYYSEITDLFCRIAECMSGRDIRSKEIQRIEGINIFQHIYIK